LMHICVHVFIYTYRHVVYIQMCSYIYMCVYIYTSIYIYMFIFSPFKATKKVKQTILKVWCCFFSVDLCSSKAREHETDMHLYNLQPFKSASDRNENNGDGDTIALIQYVYIHLDTCIYICIYLFSQKTTETSNLCVYPYISISDRRMCLHTCLYMWTHIYVYRIWFSLCIYITISLYRYTNIYIYVYIWTHIYISFWLYIHIFQINIWVCFGGFDDGQTKKIFKSSEVTEKGKQGCMYIYIYRRVHVWFC
jgi:hypothetical protein